MVIVDVVKATHWLESDINRKIDTMSPIVQLTAVVAGNEIIGLFEARAYTMFTRRRRFRKHVLDWMDDMRACGAVDFELIYPVLG